MTPTRHVEVGTVSLMDENVLLNVHQIETNMKAAALLDIL